MNESVWGDRPAAASVGGRGGRSTYSPSRPISLKRSGILLLTVISVNPGRGTYKVVVVGYNRTGYTDTPFIPTFFAFCLYTYFLITSIINKNYISCIKYVPMQVAKYPATFSKRRVLILRGLSLTYVTNRRMRTNANERGKHRVNLIYLPTFAFCR